MQSKGPWSLLLAVMKPKPRQVAAQIKAKGHLADGFGCDVTNLANVQETVNKILDIHKRIDILVNNAGITRDNLLLTA